MGKLHNYGSTGFSSNLPITSENHFSHRISYVRESLATNKIGNLLMESLLLFVQAYLRIRHVQVLTIGKIVQLKEACKLNIETNF